ncbi:MAG: type II toxin-antitoxin system VapB family antitoxin [bacterium]
MKTTIDIPNDLLEEAVFFSGSRTKREVVLTALAEFNQRHRLARLIKTFGTCTRFMTAQELEDTRTEG